MSRFASSYQIPSTSASILVHHISPEFCALRVEDLRFADYNPGLQTIQRSDIGHCDKAMSNERTPLLSGYEGNTDPHEQFCLITGVPPSNTDKRPKVSSRSLYGRATHQFHQVRALHAFMATLSTTALLSQVVIGAAVTALGASQSSHILITVFGAMNTVIAGIVAYLKSRGQPMRTRMFRDDLERVVDEIENSEVMWLGITEGIHGYDEIDIDDKVTVRTEVARLMRLYERAMRSNVLNNPDNYLLADFGCCRHSSTRTAGWRYKYRTSGYNCR